jgi:hypothetical protein
MKKIILIAAVLITIISCSNDKENKSNDNTVIREKLVGSWKLIGYYDDIDNDPITGTNYHPVMDGGITSFYSNNVFDNDYYTTNYNGLYSVTTDSILSMNYTTTASGEPYTYISKIYLLNNYELRIGSVPDSGSLGDLSCYEKINP